MDATRTRRAEGIGEKKPRSLRRVRCTSGHDGHACRRLTCGICGTTRVGDYATRISTNAAALPKIVVMTSVTAPGHDGLRAWGDQLVESLDREDLGEDELALLRIVHEDGYAAAFNATFSKRLSKAHRAAYARTRREHRCAPRIALRVVESHERGLLHAHLVLVGPHAVCQTYAEALSDLSGAYGLGYVDRGTKRRENGWQRQLKPMTGARAARYVGKYVSKNMRGSHGPKTVAGVQEQMRAGRKRAGGNVVYIGKLLTTKTGVTARWLRWVRVAYVFGADPFTGEEVRPSEARAELHLEGKALPRPPPAHEMERAAAWRTANPAPIEGLDAKTQRMIRSVLGS